MTTSNGCAAWPTSLDRFDEVWSHDFEFRIDDCHRPVPVAMSAKEHRTGAEITLRRDQLLALQRAPFNIGSNSLVTGYSVVAELSCFKVLGWPWPRHVLCTYVETCAAINGLEIEGLATKRPNILEACDLFQIKRDYMTAERKAFMRDLILNNVNYSEEQWRLIEDYNRDDVLLEMSLFEALMS